MTVGLHGCVYKARAVADGAEGKDALRQAEQEKQRTLHLSAVSSTIPSILPNTITDGEVAQQLRAIYFHIFKCSKIIRLARTSSARLGQHSSALSV